MPIAPKERACCGKGMAKGYYDACGKLSFYNDTKTGLCGSCLYDWMNNTETGRIYKQSIWDKKTAKQTKKREKEKTKVAKAKLKTLSQYKAEAKKSFQKFIRLRDKDLPCISCNTPTSDIWDGGHYKKAELYSGVVFHELNCAKQCRYCNRFLGGNEANYRNGLLIRIGEESLLELEKTALETKQYRYTKDELIEIKKKYDQKIKELQL